MYRWNEDTIRWYAAAAWYTGFHENLAGLLRTLLPAGESLCDMGCGLGYVDLALAAHAGHVTCVDSSEAAVDELAREAKQRGLANIEAICADCDTLPGQWDTILLSFFAYRQPQRFLSQCRRLVMVMSLAGNDELFPAEWRRHPKKTAKDMCATLAAEGIPHRMVTAKFPFGQPLRDIADAEAFVRTGAPEIPQGELDAFLKVRLVSTGDARWPLLLPRGKAIGVIVMPGGLNENKEEGEVCP